MHYNSVSELVDLIETPPVCFMNASVMNHFKYRVDSNFFPQSLKALYKELESIPQETQRFIHELKMKIRDSVPAPQRDRRKRKLNQPEGYDFDLDRFRDREYDRMWVDHSTVLDATKAIRIGVNLSTGEKEDPMETRWRGATICALAELYEELGKQVEVTALSACYYNRRKLLTTVCLKQQYNRFDPNLLGVAVCNITFFRRVLLGIEVHQLTTPVDDNFYVRTLDAEEMAGYDFVIDRDVHSEYAAIEYVKGSISATEY